MRVLMLLPIICSGLFPAHAVEDIPTRAKPVIVRDIPAGRPACGSPCERIAVIFVHGITGDRVTWTHPESPKSWPELLASDPALGPILDVYQVEYYSKKNDEPSFQTISRKIGEELDARLFDKKYKKIVMVCHSLGGILCRAHLLHVKNRWGHVYLSLFKSVFTLGTPTLGSGHADNLFVRYSANEQFRVLRSNQVNDFLQQFNQNIEEFQAKRRAGCPEIKFYAGYETKKTYPVPMKSHSTPTIPA